MQADSLPSEPPGRPPKNGNEPEKRELFKYFVKYYIYCCCRLVAKSKVSNSFAIPWTVACQIPLSMEFSRQEYWSGLPFPPPEDLLDPGIKPSSLISPALGRRVLPRSPLGLWGYTKSSVVKWCRTLCHPAGCSLPARFSGKNRVICHFLLQDLKPHFIPKNDIKKPSFLGCSKLVGFSKQG